MECLDHQNVDKSLTDDKFENSGHWQLIQRFKYEPHSTETDSYNLIPKDPHVQTTVSRILRLHEKCRIRHGRIHTAESAFFGGKSLSVCKHDAGSGG